ncbi:asparagine synthase (glutamine-hydrolyzing) [Myxococcota bacterium]|nr:asparagine synthase (glutamine-hydrolyzing) [Myxococcota bacterium]MBU1430924.1 asparagine synthase (glutamine-hydrolyzing) [Myxococcota bacterium]MBU1898321.1 asparagine synthase (glutamine-hydrolyzing) [Myxococcota bacterium]
MCGIFAALGPVRAGRLDAVEAALRRRGPDGAGRWIDATAGICLAHTRLALTGHHAPQPLHDEDGQIHAVVNGELYGYEAIRATLEAEGHRFNTDGDSEILIHLYQARGLRCLDALRGEFAFALWDGRRRRLFAARDRFGIKPLRFTRPPQGGLWISSNAAALFAYGHPARWDLEAFAQLSVHQYPRAHQTPFQGVEMLPPGCALVMEGGALRAWRYWDPTAIEEAPFEEGAAIEALRASLEEAVALRARSAAPLAYALSGGLDSSLISALGARQASAPIHTFGVFFSDPARGAELTDYDERAAASAVAAHIGAQHHPVEVTRQDLLLDLDEAVAASEGWAINGQLVGKHRLSAAVAAAGFKGILTGEGADEACFGYAHLLHDLGLAQARPAHQAPQGGIMLAEGEATPGLEIIQARLGHTPSFLKAKAEIGARLRPLLRLEIDPGARLTTLLGDFDERLKGLCPARQSAALWSELSLGGYILPTLGDGAEMAYGLEGRPPFLDHRFFEAAWRIPAARHAGPLEKRLLRAAAPPGLLPLSALRRPKRPFLAPPLWGGALARGYIRDHLSPARLRALPFLAPERVQAWLERLDEDPEAQRRADPVLMLLLTTEALGRRFGLSG